jgi:hypothetical protein
MDMAHRRICSDVIFVIAVVLFSAKLPHKRLLRKSKKHDEGLCDRVDSVTFHDKIPIWRA